MRDAAFCASSHLTWVPVPEHALALQVLSILYKMEMHSLKQNNKQEWKEERHARNGTLLPLEAFTTPLEFFIKLR
jgi:hypothetical protein